MWLSREREVVERGGRPGAVPAAGDERKGGRWCLESKIANGRQASGWD